MQKDYTRDVNPEKMMKALGEGGAFKPFVDFVRGSEDLALCFRGNDTPEKVIIYRHNHCMWELYLSRNIPTVSISPDHTRFIENWDKTIVKELMDLGFRPNKGESYETLIQAGTLAKRGKKTIEGKVSYEYHLINLFKKIGSDYEDTMQFIKASYDILVRMQKSYFEEKTPINYIKKYFFTQNADAKDVDPNHNFEATPQPCVEKHVQQDLFSNNHCLKSGMFLYDLEFAQPSIGVKLPDKNKPDMFGIRFDENGAPASICMVEVKSTKSALNQNSGLKAHLEGMKEYITKTRHSETGEIYLMMDRKKEAVNIMNHYHDLGLYGVEHRFEVGAFDDLPVEIVFIFSNGLTLDNKLDDGTTIKETLTGFEAYGEMTCGEYPQKIVVVKKQF